MRLQIQSFRQAAFWSTAINAVSQVLALGFSMLMAALFGAQESTDVLYYCLGVFILLSGLFQTVNVNVLIPETMRRRHQEGEDDAMAFTNRVFAVYGLLIAGLTAWILINPLGTLTLISKFPEEVLQRNARLVFWLLATMPLQMVAQLLLDVLVSYKFLTLPATVSCVSRVINILFVWMFHRHLGVISMALGLLLGLVLQILLNVYLLGRVLHWKPRVWRTRIGRTVYRNIAWAEAGVLASTAAGYIPLFLFSGFSAGALTALNYAKRLCLMPTQLLTNQVSGVVGIKFNELAAKRELPEMARSFDQLSRVLTSVLLPVAFALMLVQLEIAQILFGRGRFTPEAVADVGMLFGWLILTLPFEAINAMVARYFVARQAIPQALPLQLLGAALMAGAVYLCIRFMGPIGYPVGMLVRWLVYLLVLAVVMPRLFPGVSLWPTLRSWAATLLGAGLAAAATRLVCARFVGGDWSPMVSAPVKVALFAALYGGVLALAPPDREAQEYVLSMVRHLGKRRNI
jgi:putative peptidoglycan lipid II flippase